MTTEALLFSRQILGPLADDFKGESELFHLLTKLLNLSDKKSEKNGTKTDSNFIRLLYK